LYNNKVFVINDETYTSTSKYQRYINLLIIGNLSNNNY